MNRIVAVRKDETGSISHYQDSNGKVYDKEGIVYAVDAGLVDGLAVFTTRDGSSSVRSNRGQEDYSLSELPTF